MDRQTLRDWVIRYNEHGLDGLVDQPRDGRPPKLDAQEKAALVELVLAGPDPEVSGISAFTRDDLVAICQERFGKSLHAASLGASCAISGCRARRRVQAICKKTRSLKRPLKRAPALLQKIQRPCKNKRIRLFFQDQARIGQKGRTCHVWWRRGQRPLGLCDKRFTFAYIFATVEPGTDNGFALVMPYVNTDRSAISEAAF